MISMSTYFENDLVSHILNQAAVWGLGTAAATNLVSDPARTLEDKKKKNRQATLAGLAGAITGAAGAAV